MASARPGASQTGQGSVGEEGQGPPTSGDSPAAQELSYLLDELPENYIIFARAYVHGGCRNKGRAAIVAGFSRTDSVYRARKLCKQPKIVRLIELLKVGFTAAEMVPIVPTYSTLERHDLQEYVNEITPKELVDHMAAILRATPFDFIHRAPKTGGLSVKLLSSLSNDALRAVKKITVRKDGSFTVEMHDKMKIIEGLARRYGLYKPPIAVPVPVGDDGEEAALPTNVEGLEDVPGTLEQILEEGGVTFRQVVNELVVHGTEPT